MNNSVPCVSYKRVFQLLDPIPPALAETGKKVYFVGATLRPETMYGQTNFYLHPEMECVFCGYVIFLVCIVQISATESHTAQVVQCSFAVLIFTSVHVL